MRLTDATVNDLRCPNGKKQGVATVYQRAQLMEERKAWAGFVVAAMMGWGAGGPKPQ